MSLLLLHAHLIVQYTGDRTIPAEETSAYGTQAVHAEEGETSRTSTSEEQDSTSTDPEDVSTTTQTSTSTADPR